MPDSAALADTGRLDAKTGAMVFLAFAATQLPLGTWLDRQGPKRVIPWFLSLAVLGCLARRGWQASRLIGWGAPLSLAVLAVNILAGSATGWLGWALFCVSSSAMGLAQPAVGMVFRASLAGRALSAYNLVIFAGVFVVQWGIGLLIDAFAAMGLAQLASFQAAMGVFLCCCIASYAYFLSVKADNSQQ